MDIRETAGAPRIVWLDTQGYSIIKGRCETKNAEA